MDKNLESAYTPDLYNTFVDTPESDIPESLRDSVFLDAKKDPAFKRLFGEVVSRVFRKNSLFQHQI